MNIEPYKSVGVVNLDVQVIELLELFGMPERKETNHIGLVEYDYGSQIFRFDSAGILEEITVDAESIELDGITIPFSKLPSYIKAEDTGLFERYGSIISPKFGLAFNPDHQSWVTVITKSGIVAWEKI